MKHVLLIALFLSTTGLAEPVKLIPYVFVPGTPADLSGEWQVDAKKNSSLYTSRTNPAERDFRATVEFRSATAHEKSGDILIRVFPAGEPNNGTYIYGNLKNKQYRYPGHRCTGEFIMDAKTKVIQEWRGTCGAGKDKPTIPLRIVRSGSAG